MFLQPLDFTTSFSSFSFSVNFIDYCEISSVKQIISLMVFQLPDTYNAINNKGHVSQHKESHIKFSNPYLSNWLNQ